jgi:hypothetical protein
VFTSRLRRVGVDRELARPDERFEFGLDVLVRGLAAQREASAEA